MTESKDPWSDLEAELVELERATKTARRNLRANDQYLRRRLLALLAFTIFSSASVVVTSHPVLQILSLVAVVLSAWVSGAIVAARQFGAELLREAEVADEAAEPAERRTRLARFNETARAYPDLWDRVEKIAVPIALTLLTSAALLIGALIKF